MVGNFAHLLPYYPIVICERIFALYKYTYNVSYFQIRNVVISDVTDAMEMEKSLYKFGFFGAIRDAGLD